MKNYLEKLTKEIELRGLAKSTKSAYLRHVTNFLTFYNQKDPKQLGLSEIKDYLHHLQHEKPVLANNRILSIRIFKSIK
jgi:site-specific recombinase XerD